VYKNTDSCYIWVNEYLNNNKIHYYIFLYLLIINL